MPDQTTLKSRLDALDELRSVAATPGGIVAGVPGGAVSLLAWWLREATGRTVLLVGTEPESLYRDCAVWGGEAGLALFAAADTLPFDRVAPGEEVIRRRLATLSLLSAGGPALVVASPAALLRPTLPPALVRDDLGMAARAVDLGARADGVVVRVTVHGVDGGREQ